MKSVNCLLAVAIRNVSQPEILLANLPALLILEVREEVVCQHQEQKGDDEYGPCCPNHDLTGNRCVRFANIPPNTCVPHLPTQCLSKSSSYRNDSLRSLTSHINGTLIMRLEQLWMHVKTYVHDAIWRPKLLICLQAIWRCHVEHNSPINCIQTLLLDGTSLVFIEAVP